MTGSQTEVHSVERVRVSRLKGTLGDVSSYSLTLQVRGEAWRREPMFPRSYRGTSGSCPRALSPALWALRAALGVTPGHHNQARSSQHLLNPGDKLARFEGVLPNSSCL